MLFHYFAISLRATTDRGKEMGAGRLSRFHVTEFTPGYARRHAATMMRQLAAQLIF
jgi:hypothetical protein